MARLMNSRNCAIASVTLAALLLLTACGSTSASPTATIVPEQPTAVTTDPAPEPTPTPQEATPEPPAVEDPDVYPEPVRLAIDAAAGEAGVDPDDVTVVSVQEREWPSTALGCPQPGFSYAQVVTPGFLVLLLIDDVEYEYHTNMRTSVVLCVAAGTD